MPLIYSIATCTAFMALAGAAFAQDAAPVPAAAQGVWAEAGKCTGETVTVTANTLRYKGQDPQGVHFETDAGPSGYGAIMYSEEGNVDNFEYVEGKDELAYNPQGFGMGVAPVVYKRCAAASSSSAPPLSTPENRCGWYVNLTPGDLWLVDRQATWILTSQGDVQGPAAVDVEKAPDFDRTQFHAVQGDYGYGCACISVDVDPATDLVTKVHGGKALPLATCKADRSLPPESKW
jgi:hypothetical protein